MVTKAAEIASKEDTSTEVEVKEPESTPLIVRLTEEYTNAGAMDRAGQAVGFTWSVVTSNDGVLRQSAQEIAKALQDNELSPQERKEFERAVSAANKSGGSEAERKLLTMINDELAKSNSPIRVIDGNRPGGDTNSRSFDLYNKDTSEITPLAEFKLSDQRAESPTKAAELAAQLADGDISASDKLRLALALGEARLGEEELARQINKELEKQGSSLRISGRDIPDSRWLAQSADNTGNYNRSYELIDINTGERKPLVKFDRSNPILCDALPDLIEQPPKIEWPSLQGVADQVMQSLPPNHKSGHDLHKLMHDAILFAANEGKADEFLKQLNQRLQESGSDIRIAHYTTKGTMGFRDQEHFQVVDGKNGRVFASGIVDTSHYGQHFYGDTGIPNNSIPQIKGNPRWDRPGAITLPYYPNEPRTEPSIMPSPYRPDDLHPEPVRPAQRNWNDLLDLLDRKHTMFLLEDGRYLFIGEPWSDSNARNNHAFIGTPGNMRDIVLESGLVDMTNGNYYMTPEGQLFVGSSWDGRKRQSTLNGKPLEKVSSSNYDIKATESGLTIKPKTGRRTKADASIDLL